MASEKLSGAYAKRFKNLNNTKPSSQSKPQRESTSTGSAYGDTMRSNWEREQKKSPQRTIEEKPVAKTRSTIEAKEKAKTRSMIEAAFVGNSKSAPPSKEEQERMRKQGARNAANQYSGKYSGRRG